MPEHFEGFFPETLAFFEDLAAHNDRDWFAAHREVYEHFVLDPTRSFVMAMGERLRALSPGIQAIPQVNGSIFRINRDTRFSADKTPYKTNLGVFFWEGNGARMECPGFYVHVDPASPLSGMNARPKIMLGAGLHMFPREILQKYRDAVVDPTLGANLDLAVGAVRDALGPESLAMESCGGLIEAYKKVPPGYPPDHPRAELLKLKGLHAGVSGVVPPEFFAAEFTVWCFERFEAVAPVHSWLVKMLVRSP
jgi:uncharacterized protein (TIGR02453 family)